MPTTALHRPVTAAMLACAALIPAACQQEAPPAQESADLVPGAPEGPSGVEVSGARIVLPPVAGNPGALYFNIANGGDQPLIIAGAYVTGAGMAMLHTTRIEGRNATMEHVTKVPLPVGETVTFAPGGMHVMVHDIGPAISAGEKAEVTLTFGSGDKISFPATVQTVGGAS